MKFTVDLAIFCSMIGLVVGIITVWRFMNGRLTKRIEEHPKVIKLNDCVENLEVGVKDIKENLDKLAEKVDKNFEKVTEKIDRLVEKLL